MKMLEAMTTRQKITEARKEVDVNKDDGNDNCGPEIVGKVKSDYDEIMKLDACQDPLDLPTHVSMLNADQKRVYDRIIQATCYTNRSMRIANVSVVT